MGQNSSPSEKAKEPRLEGIFIAFSILLWSSLCFLAPGYLDMANLGSVLFNFLGVVLAVIAVGGALIEASKLTENEGLSYLGVGAVFAIPGLVLFFLDQYVGLNSPWKGISRVSVLLLAAIAGPFFGLGAAHWANPVARKARSELAAEERRANTAKTVEAVIVAVLGVASGILNLISALT